MLGKVFKFFLFLPTVLPSILLVIMFKYFVNEAIPNYIMEFIPGTKISALLQDKTFKMPLIIFYNLWVCFGAQILIYSGAMDQIPPEIIEAGKVEGEELEAFLHTVNTCAVNCLSYAIFIFFSVITLGFKYIKLVS